MKDISIGIVEDEGIVVLDLVKSLKIYGCSVLFSVDSGEAALEKLKTIKPDIIIMDIYLKGPEDGIETAEKIEKLYSIPIIFVTAYNEDALSKSSIKLKNFKFIRKPFEYSTLNSAIEELSPKS
jgi:two-component SAPR family response regulator